MSYSQANSSHRQYRGTALVHVKLRQRFKYTYRQQHQKNALRLTDIVMLSLQTRPYNFEKNLFFLKAPLCHYILKTLKRNTCHITIKKIIWHQRVIWSMTLKGLQPLQVVKQCQRHDTELISTRLMALVSILTGRNATSMSSVRRWSLVEYLLTENDICIFRPYGLSSLSLPYSNDH